VKARNGRVRVVGAGHSWSRVLPEDGSAVIYLDNFRAIHQDPADYTMVTLQGMLAADRSCLRPGSACIDWKVP
jgi:hypothetical protein